MSEKEFITLENVTFSYEDSDENESEKGIAKQSPAVENVSLTIKEGDFVCVIGRNGSGKSTIARLMNALVLPSDGVVWVDGMDTKDENNLWEVRRTTGMVFQNPDNQIIGSSVEEDVAFGTENLGIPREEMIVRVKNAIDGCGLSEYKDAQPHLLSGGQKQRVAIAGILAMKPKCIVLDESTAMLDPRGRKDVLGIVKKLNKEEGITIVLITHHMDEIVDADEVILVDRSHVIKEGTPRELFEDSQLIENSGLGLPMTAKLFDLMKKDGYNVPSAVLTVDEGEEILVAGMKEN